MNDPHAIQPYGQNLPAGTPGQTAPTGAIMTPQGPAIIQVIDMPGMALGPVDREAGAAGARPMPGGINILGAVLRRWWLVLLVFVLVGGTGFVAANKFVKPTYDVTARITYQQMADDQNSETERVVRRAAKIITDREISLLAARNPQMMQAVPELQQMDLTTPAGQQKAVLRLRDIVDATEDPHTGTVDIDTSQPSGFQAATIANAYANAFVEYCSQSLSGANSSARKNLEEECDKIMVQINGLYQLRDKLAVETNVDMKDLQKESLVKHINDLQQKRGEADIKARVAGAQLDRFLKSQGDASALEAAQKLERMKMIDEEKGKDSILQADITERVTAHGAVAQLLAQGMTEEHPDVKRARQRETWAQDAITKRENEIALTINTKVSEQQKLIQQKNVQETRQQVEESQSLVKQCEEELKRINDESKSMASARMKLDEYSRRIEYLKKGYDDAWSQLQEVIKVDLRRGPNAVLRVSDAAQIPPMPSEDKRVKMQAASCVGGLFLGVLLALLVDRFDRRLRDPRDVEALLGAPMLGTIPKIQELKRIKGDQARNLIAEEFRVIRTHILFGNPHLQYKSICVTSPAPGDGKTSLSVNLAISIAKAGRRTLLIDGDLRKPDVHRIFNIPDQPGLAELIQGTCEPGAAIRKTDIELLDVLPAGLPMVRPSELLSRPEMGRLIEALGELYDHVIFDSAPLLPVSDTHVLVGLVTGVVCSFNASVDYGTVQMVDEILRRNHATLIGSVVNQVKYKQSSAYHRGKASYDSYYNSARYGDGKALAKAEGKKTA
jgi:polysaccharide biosynthesis transport protein